MIAALRAHPVHTARVPLLFQRALAGCVPHHSRSFASSAVPKNIFGKDGKSLVVPIDHGTFIPVPALGNVSEVIKALAPYADAFIANMGIIKQCHESFGGKAILLRADIYRSHLALTSQAGGDSALNMYCGYGIRDARQAGADGVIAMMFPGSPNEKDITQNCCRLVSEALEVSVPVMIEAVPGGLGMPDLYTPENVDYVVRAAAELGADIVKTPFTDKESFRTTVQACPVPVVILGGAHKGDTKSIFEMVADSIAVGGAGIAIGRNLWQDPKPVSMIKALAAIIHEGATADIALELYNADSGLPPTAPVATKTNAACPKRFIDSEASVVRDAIDGLIWGAPFLGRLDAFPDVKVVFRTDWDKGRVALVSGGGAGHEPMQSGFVGKGMLTAAVVGETFASPGVDAVLSAIIQVTGPQGCLVVITNYTGDRLNFLLAAQRARTEFGLKVETVIVGDDVATTARRGLAGNLLVHKVAGAAAEEGRTLAEVKELAEATASATASLGVSFSSVRRLKPETVGPDDMEVGMGVHGEPGARTEAMAPVSEIVDIIMKAVTSRLGPHTPSHGYACLVNNLGGVPIIEMYVLLGALMKSMWAPEIKLLVGPAAMCTSLDMNGLSLSLLRLTPEFASYLTTKTAAPAWPGAIVPSFDVPTKCTQDLDPLKGIVASTDEAVAIVLEKVCTALIASRTELDELDGLVGDGDCGATFAAAASAVLAAKPMLPLADPRATCNCLAAVLAKAVGGTSGALLSLMFARMAGSFEQSGNQTWELGGASALMDGVSAMMEAGGAAPGDRTMLDALHPAAQALVDGDGLRGAAQAAKAGSEATRNMIPRAGRSENVPESVWRDVPDPGSRAVATVFDAAMV